MHSRNVGCYYCLFNLIQFHHVLHQQWGADCRAVCHFQQNSAAHDHAALLRSRVMGIYECGTRRAPVAFLDKVNVVCFKGKSAEIFNSDSIKCPQCNSPSGLQNARTVSVGYLACYSAREQSSGDTSPPPSSVSASASSSWWWVISFWTKKNLFEILLRELKVRNRSYYEKDRRDFMMIG